MVLGGPLCRGGDSELFRRNPGPPPRSAETGANPNSGNGSRIPAEGRRSSPRPHGFPVIGCEAIRDAGSDTPPPGVASPPVAVHHVRPPSMTLWTGGDIVGIVLPVRVQVTITRPRLGENHHRADCPPGWRCGAVRLFRQAVSQSPPPSSEPSSITPSTSRTLG